MIDRRLTRNLLKLITSCKIVHFIITGRICRRQLCRYCFYSRADFGVFRPAGATRCTDKGDIYLIYLIYIYHCAKFQLDRFRGEGLRPPKLKKRNFTNIITHKGRVPCTIFTKFTGYMRVLSLHNFAKFGCFILINDKIINNFSSMWAFSAKFSMTSSG